MEGRLRGVWSTMTRRSARVVVGGAAALVAVLATACTNPARVDEDGAAAVAAEPAELRWRPLDDEVVCDGTSRPVGTIEQAEQGEPIELTSPMPVELDELAAGADGVAVLTWSCEPAEAELRWELVATGVESGRTVSFAIAGAPVPVEAEPLEAAVHTDRVPCDGLDHEVGVVGGFAPGERVEVDADRRGAQVDDRADVDGNLALAWGCRPGDVGETWTVAVAAPDSDRSVTVSLTGADAGDDRPLAVESAVAEVACDGRVQVLATITGLFPFETVTFAAPGSEDLRDGDADGGGRLDLRWQCDRGDVGRTWERVDTASETGKSVGLTFVGVAGDPVGPATVRLVEDPFVCDGERRPVAVLTDLLDGEFVDFASAQSESLREGRFVGGELTVNWQCGDADLDGADRTVWEVTATGRQSGRSAAFEVVGVRP